MLLNLVFRKELHIKNNLATLILLGTFYVLQHDLHTFKQNMLSKSTPFKYVNFRNINVESFSLERH